MASQAQIEANRRNGAKSRGPKTPEGKRISSQNALKHGLRSGKLLVLSNESGDNYDNLLAACKAHFTPANAYEAELVQEIAAARWRLRRAWTVETNLLDIQMQEQDPALRKRYTEFDEGTRLASAFTALADKGNSLTLLTRYEAALRRSFQSTVKLLEKAKLPNEPNSRP
jgi:hypothetical protein